MYILLKFLMAKERDVNNLYEKCQPILSFNEEELKKGEETLKNSA